MPSKLYEKIKNWIFPFYAKLFTQPKSVGARALVINQDQILLVKHTYISGWYTIGGGVEKGETGLEALKRELEEEVGIIIEENPSIFGFYHNTLGKCDDYIILYLCKTFDKKEAQSWEIREARWFPLQELPTDTSPATKRRVAEYLGLKPLSDKW